MAVVLPVLTVVVVLEDMIHYGPKESRQGGQVRSGQSEEKGLKEDKGEDMTALSGDRDSKCLLVVITILFPSVIHRRTGESDCVCLFLKPEEHFFASVTGCWW